MKGGSLTKIHTRDLENFVVETGFIDHLATGCYFTCSNRREEELQLHKLDKIMVNDKWINMNSFSKARFLELAMSYHSTSILQLSDLEDAGPKPFKYFGLGVHMIIFYLLF